MINDFRDALAMVDHTSDMEEVVRHAIARAAQHVYPQDFDNQYLLRVHVAALLAATTAVSMHGEDRLSTLFEVIRKDYEALMNPQEKGRSGEE